MLEVACFSAGALHAFKNSGKFDMFAHKF